MARVRNALGHTVALERRACRVLRQVRSTQRRERCPPDDEAERRVRLRPGSRDHVWSYDFVFTRTSDGRPLRLLTMLDEFTRECLAIDVARRIKSDDVLGRLAQLFAQRGAPAYVRSDNGPEFTARALRIWLSRVEVQTLYIESGSPWENGYIESFNGRLRDELLTGEVLDTVLEA